MRSIKKFLEIGRHVLQRGFTLIEIMVVIIVIGTITAVALPNYSKVMEQSYCRDAQINVMRITSAATVHLVKDQTASISGMGSPAIFAAFNIQLNENKFIYKYFGTADSFSIEAARYGPGTPDYKVEVVGDANTHTMSITGTSANVCSLLF